MATPTCLYCGSPCKDLYCSTACEDAHCDLIVEPDQCSCCGESPCVQNCHDDDYYCQRPLTSSPVPPTILIATKTFARTEVRQIDAQALGKASGMFFGPRETDTAEAREARIQELALRFDGGCDLWTDKPLKGRAAREWEAVQKEIRKQETKGR